MDTIKQLSVFARNKPGQIERLTKIMGDHKINILAISISSLQDMGVIKFIVNQCDKAFEVLKEEGLMVSINEVFAIKLVDKPGGLFQVAKTLGEKKVNISNSYIFVQESRKQGYMLIEVDDVEKTKEALKKTRMQFLKEKDIEVKPKKAVKPKTKKS